MDGGEQLSAPKVKKKRASTTKRMIIMLLTVGIVLGLVFGFQVFKSHMIQQAIAAMANPPQTVSTTVAAQAEWQDSVEAVGSLRAVNGADLSFEVSGVVAEMMFQSGDEVAAGTPLMRLRNEDEISKLAALQATADLADTVLQRDQAQLRIRAVSQAQVDSDEANLRNARAQVRQQQAIVDKFTLRAPFAGRLGLRMADLGQFLNAGTTVVTLQSLDPIYVDFFLPQQALSQIRVGQPVTARVDTYRGQTFGGEISAINPRIDTASRNVQVRATLRNPDHRLMPGMYATTSIAVGEPQRYVTLPQTAIAFNSYGAVAYVIEQQGQGLVARQTFVTTGPTRGDQVAVLRGVEPGATVVTAGQIKLRNGSPVVVNNAIQPRNDANPTPTEQ
jgi:membrane fusion protein (multidrug efflux system)